MYFKNFERFLSADLTCSSVDWLVPLVFNQAFFYSRYAISFFGFVCENCWFSIAKGYLEPICDITKDCNCLSGCSFEISVQGALFYQKWWSIYYYHYTLSTSQNIRLKCWISFFYPLSYFRIFYYNWLRLVMLMKSNPSFREISIFQFSMFYLHSRHFWIVQNFLYWFYIFLNTRVEFSMYECYIICSADLIVLFVWNFGQSHYYLLIHFLYILLSVCYFSLLCNNFQSPVLFCYKLFY